MYVIVPEARCDPGLFRDILQFGQTAYFLLRVPYSVIEALHDREFKMIGQPVALEHVNDAIDAYGFDFIEPPEADLTVDLHAGNVLVELRSFYAAAWIPTTLPTWRIRDAETWRWCSSTPPTTARRSACTKTTS